MADVTSFTITNGLATLAVSDVTGLLPGAVAYLYGLSDNLDGARQLVSVDQDNDEVTITTAQPDTTEAVEPDAAIISSSVQWCNAADVEVYLGITVEDSDADYLDFCVAAANDFAYRRRYAAGYDDHPDNTPTIAVQTGTIIYAGTLFRERGSTDAFNSYDAYPAVPVAGLGQVMRLLGINRASIA